MACDSTAVGRWAVTSLAAMTSSLPRRRADRQRVLARQQESVTVGVHHAIAVNCFIDFQLRGEGRVTKGHLKKPIKGICSWYTAADCL